LRGPAIHLGYERKSWGAYNDLGLSEYGHSARSFDPEVVSVRAQGLLADASDSWSRVERQRPALFEASERLTAMVGRRVGAVA
jgi:polysaccharide pyruvyl transferase WcaK-like protein